MMIKKKKRRLAWAHPVTKELDDSKQKPKGEWNLSFILNRNE
jgi:hypothetical protein